METEILSGVLSRAERDAAMPESPDLGQTRPSEMPRRRRARPVSVSRPVPLKGAMLFSLWGGELYRAT